MAGKKVPPAPRPPSRRRLSEEERRLWRQVTQQVDRLRPERDAAPAPEPAPAPDAPLPAGGPRLAPVKPPDPAPAKAKGPPPVRLGRLDNIDRATARRFALGERAIDGTLDLHGMTQAAARDRLVDFLLGAWARGWRCVLVITGKGIETPDHRPWPEPEPRGILRRALPQWLNEPPLKGKILALTHARPQHGGLGAFYVLIRRDREERRG